jgi:hypothetical protein
MGENKEIPPCYLISEDCREDPADCPSYCSAVPCWSTNDVPCCRRNDKSRCCYCSVYLSFLDWKETGLLFRTRQESFEDAGFKRMSKAKHDSSTRGQCKENASQCTAIAGSAAHFS